jgi:hypothetical protein
MPSSPRECEIDLEIYVTIALERDETSRAKRGTNNSANCRALPAIEDPHRLGALG